MNIILLSVLALGAIGALGALILFWASKQFHVDEDPRISRIEEILPSVNCGGCGFPGCSAFAEALVKADTPNSLYCPVGGAPVMNRAASILGKAVEVSVPKIAVVRCNGTCDDRPKTSLYDGAATCAIASNLYGGETACSFGCLGFGDCVKVCPFDAIHIYPVTWLPEVDEEKCTACGNCVKACPKLLIQLRKKGPGSRRIYVSCRNQDKPAIANVVCNVSCISCKKCVKVCPFDAITIENDLATINDDKCRLCRKCVRVCPNSAIVELNFPVKRDVENI